MKKTTLPASLASAEDIREAIDSLHELTRVSTVTRQSLPDTLRPLYDEGFLKDAGTIRETIESFERVLKEAPRIGLTLAGPVDAAHRADLTAWCRSNLSPDVIVSFSFNRALLGGVLVRAGSRIYDWSYRSRLLDSPVRFSEVLSRV